jgi:hypothetical protein
MITGSYGCQISKKRPPFGFRQQAAATQGGATAHCEASECGFLRIQFLLYKNVAVFNHDGLDQIYCNDCYETSDEIESMALSDG